MTDGPFKNMKLGSRWKRLAEAVQNDAVDQSECTALANDTIVRELVTPANNAILSDLEAYAGRDQMDFDPISSVEAVFEQHPKTPFNDQLQKELTYRLSDGVPVGSALSDAVEASATSHIGETRNRFQEECLRLREAKELSTDKCRSTIDKVNATFDAVDIPGLCKAVREGDKNAFKATTNKKDGLDEGPSL
tara:strand:+ start:688 stop:1263 length:576 start_codon:yes stop_codon:yes gene_type:complete